MPQKRAYIQGIKGQLRSKNETKENNCQLSYNKCIKELSDAYIEVGFEKKLKNKEMTTNLKEACANEEQFGIYGRLQHE